MTTLKNNRGSSIIGALFLVLIIALAGASALSMTTNERFSSSNSLNAIQAYYADQAGLEWGRRRIAQFLPTDSPKTFGQGTFTVAASQFTGKMTSIGRVGKATKTNTVSVYYPMPESIVGCVRINQTGAAPQMRYTGGNNVSLTGVSIDNYCGTFTPQLAGIKVEWFNSTSCQRNATDEAVCSRNASDPLFAAAAGQAKMCHANTANPHNVIWQTLNIDPSLWATAAPTGYGQDSYAPNNLDYLGPCKGSATITCAQEYEMASICGDDSAAVAHDNMGLGLTRIYLNGNMIYSNPTFPGTPSGTNSWIGMSTLLPPTTSYFEDRTTGQTPAAPPVAHGFDFLTSSPPAPGVNAYVRISLTINDNPHSRTETVTKDFMVGYAPN